MKKSELKQLIRESYKELLKEEIKTINGKKYKKQSNGKWVEVSKFGMTKKEHNYQANYSKEMSEKPSLHTSKHEDAEKWHKTEASKLSEKEYSDEELNNLTENISLSELKQLIRETISTLHEGKNEYSISIKIPTECISHMKKLKIPPQNYSEVFTDYIEQLIGVYDSQELDLFEMWTDESDNITDYQSTNTENLDEGFVDWIKGVNWYKKYWKLAFGYYNKIDPEIAKVVAKKGVAEEKAGWKMLSGDTKFRDALVKFSSTISAGTGAVGGGSTKVVPAWVTKLVNDYKKDPTMFDDEIDDIVGGIA